MAEFVFNNVNYIIIEKSKGYFSLKRLDNENISNKNEIIKDFLNAQTNLSNEEKEVINGTEETYKLCKYAYRFLENGSINIRRNTTRNNNLNSRFFRKVSNDLFDKCDWTEVEFYERAEAFLTEYARESGVTDLDKYFEQTDFLDSGIYKRANGYNLSYDTEIDKINYLFAQIAYHATNGSNSPFVDFDELINERKEIHCNFDPIAFLEKNYTENINQSTEEFSCLIYKKHTPNKVLKVNKYIKLMNNAAKYIYDLKQRNENLTREDIINKIENEFTLHPPFGGIYYVLNTILLGGNEEKLNINITLVCDLIKELDQRFNYLCKPDLHIRYFIGRYLGKNYNESEKAINECQLKFIEMVNEIKLVHPDVTGYKFDRILYLIGSGNFFLDPNVGRVKDHSIKKQDFLNLMGNRLR